METTAYGIVIDPTAAEAGAQRTTAAFDQMNRAVDKVSTAVMQSAQDLRGLETQSTTSARTTATLTRTVTQLTTSAGLLPDSLGRVVTSLSRLAGPGGWVALAAGSVVGLTAAYRGLTRESREAAKEAEARIDRWRKERDAVSAAHQVYRDLRLEATAATEHASRPAVDPRIGAGLPGGTDLGGSGTDAFAAAIQHSRASEAARKQADAAAALEDALTPLREGTARLAREFELLNTSEEEAIDVAARHLAIRLRQEAGLGRLRGAAYAATDAAIREQTAAFRSTQQATLARRERDAATRQRQREAEERARLVERVLDSAAALDLEGQAIRDGVSDGELLVRQLLAQAQAAGLTAAQFDQVAGAARRMGQQTDAIEASRDALRVDQQRRDALDDIVAALEEERDVLTIGTDALIRRRAATLGASEAQLEMIGLTQLEISWLRAAGEAMDEFNAGQKRFGEEQQALLEHAWESATGEATDILAGLFRDATSGAEDIWINFLGRLVSSFQDALAQIAAQKLLGAILGVPVGGPIGGLLGLLFSESGGGIGASGIGDAGKVPTFATGGLVGSAAPRATTPLDPSAMLAVVHRGEQVVRPQDTARRETTGPPVALHVHAYDGDSAVRAIRANRNELARLVQEVVAQMPARR